MTLNRRHFLATSIALSVARGNWAAKPASGDGAAAVQGTRAPVILDSDIGDDIDDTWALMMLLRMPSLDLKLAVGDFGNPYYRARLLAKLLHAADRSDIPVGIGVTIPRYFDVSSEELVVDRSDAPALDEPGQQSRWLGNYRLEDYPGHIHQDGVQAIIDTINNSSEPVTLLCLGPAPNIAEALRRDPGIASNAHVVGMYGSIRRGYGGAATPAAEYNVRVDPASLQAIFAAPWEITITPLDTCGLVVLDGENYRSVYASDKPGLVALMENYRSWLPGAPYIAPDHDMSRVSTTLFDSVAVHLAAAGDLVAMERLPIKVTNDGYTVIDREQGRPVNCAVAWKDLDGFERQLAETLTR